MRNILILTEIFPPKHGGSGRWFWEIYTRVKAVNVVFAAGLHADSEKFDQNTEAKIIRLPLTSEEWGFRSVKGLLFYIKTWWKVRKICKTEKISEIHCGRCLPEGVVAWLAKLSSGVSYSCYVHGEDVETSRSSREFVLLTKVVIKSADKIICNSQNSADIMFNKWGLAKGKVIVMYPGVDINKFSPTPLRPKPDYWAGRTVLLTVGRLQKRKGHDMLIRALPALRKLHPNILYSIIGDGDERHNLEALSKDLSVQDCVEFRNEVTDEDMVACYQHCTLFVLPNRTVGRDIEGFGIVLLEAQACGRPVVAGDSGGTSETFEEGKSGFIVDSTSHDKLKVTIEAILMRSDLAALGEAGRVFVARGFSWESLAIDMDCLLN